MGISLIPPVGIVPTDNWELISSTNPNANSLEFSSISGYKKLRVIYSINSAVTITAALLNNEAGTKFGFGGKYYSNSSLTAPIQWGWDTINSGSAFVGQDFNLVDWIIDSADTNNLKSYSVFGRTSSKTWEGQGFYMASQSINSVKFTWNSTFSATVYLYGVKA